MSHVRLYRCEGWKSEPMPDGIGMTQSGFQRVDMVGFGMMTSKADIPVEFRATAAADGVWDATWTRLDATVEVL